MRIPNIVVSVWFIIVGGYIIFYDGLRWCICCRETILTAMGVICIVMGVIGLIGGMRSQNVTTR